MHMLPLHGHGYHTGWRIVRPTEFVSVVEAMNAGHAMQGWANALVIDKAGGMQAYDGVNCGDRCVDIV